LESPGARRSQRITIAIPVRVFWNGNEGVQREELTDTMLVNTTGALIALAGSVEKGRRLRMVNLRTDRESKCAVVNTRINPKGKGKMEVGIAFDEPTPRYWGLYFPPEDWMSSERKRPVRPAEPVTKSEEGQ
jgi:hypothetical protein